jgi:hypothetical protein
MCTLYAIIQSTHDRSLLERGKTIHPIIQSTHDRSLLERGKTIHPIIQSTRDCSLLERGKKGVLFYLFLRVDGHVYSV